ncbi:hypothetical protein E8E11_006933 [Didymella keratinophila]|nr:hypothetical protein E8E11_006933 [Didymella keratinophila]
MALKDVSIIQLEVSLKRRSETATEEQTLQALKTDSLEKEIEEGREFKNKVKG